MLKGPAWRPSSQLTGLSNLFAGLDVSRYGSWRATTRRGKLIICYAPKKSSKKAKQSSKGQDCSGQGGTEFASAPPPRIIDTSQLSLKRQKRFVEAKKKAEQAAAGPGKQQVPQKFRRRTLDPDERYAAERTAIEAAQAQRAAQERARKQRRAVRNMLRPREEEQQLPVLLVDGYNVLHRRWQERRPEEAVRPICLEDEREALINDTRDYSLSLRCRPIVVFDAMANRNVLATPREMTAGVEVVYTKDSDADMFITAEAKAQRAAGAPRVVVVSGDTEISASLEYRAAMGWMTAEMYLLEMKRVSHLANKAQKAAEELQYAELLEGGGNIALSALKDRVTLEKVAEMRRRLGNGRAGQGNSLFRMERW